MGFEPITFWLRTNCTAIVLLDLTESIELLGVYECVLLFMMVFHTGEIWTSYGTLTQSIHKTIVKIVEVKFGLLFKRNFYPIFHRKFKSSKLILIYLFILKWYKHFKDA